MAIEKYKLVEEIDTWVKKTTYGCSSREQADERLLEKMYGYMPMFKQLLDHCTPQEIDTFLDRYDGFFHFANLLERVAQGIQDGAIDVPDNPFSQSSNNKPSAESGHNHQEAQEKPEPIRRDITFLPAYTEIIVGSLAQTEEQLGTFAEARNKPHSLDDPIIDRAVTLYEEQLEFIPLHEKQLNWWLDEKLTDAQQFQVEDLKKKLPTLQAKTEELLQLLAELRKGTINRILEMSDEELALKILRGEIKRP